jgi:hypothetical protein
VRPFELPRLGAQALLLLIVAVGVAAAAPATSPAASGPAASASPTPVPTPAAGDVIEPFTAAGIDGTEQKIEFAKGSKTLLLFFLSGCHVCHKMIPEWNRAYADKPKGLVVQGMLMDKEPPGFFIMTPVAFPVVRAPSREFLDKIKVFRAPMMVRVGPGGKVEDAAMGQVDRMRLSQLFQP